MILIALLLAASPPPEDTLWQLVYQLGIPGKAAGAREQLKAYPLGAMPVLLRAAHVADAADPLRDAMFKRRCTVSPPNHFGLKATAGTAAAELLFELSRTDGAVRRALLGHADPYARMLALATSEGTELNAALRAVISDPSADVLRVASDRVECTNDKELIDTLRARLLVLNPISRCDDVKQAPAFVKAFFDDGLKTNGWSTSNNDAWLTTTNNGTLHWKCALAVYEGLVKRGWYEPTLLLPLLDARMPDAPKKAAAALARRDLPNLPADKKEEITSRLVLEGNGSGGGMVTVPDEPKYGDDDTLAAAAVQKAPGAREAIERKFACRGTFTVRKEIALLGYAPSPANADELVRIAGFCKDTRAAAVAALIRMRDPRAQALLPAVMDDPFGSEELGRALKDAWNPDWERVLKANRSARSFSSVARAAGHPDL